MTEITTSWQHPIFIPVIAGLVTAAVIFYCLSYVSARGKNFLGWSQQFATLAQWSLWLGTLLAIATMAMGFYGYQSLKHDEVSHLGMTNYRHWLLLTSIALLLISAWSVFHYRKSKKPTLLFVIALLILEGLLLPTAWWGGFINPHGLGDVPADDAAVYQYNDLG